MLLDAVGLPLVLLFAELCVWSLPDVDLAAGASSSKNAAKTTGEAAERREAGLAGWASSAAGIGLVPRSCILL